MSAAAPQSPSGDGLVYLFVYGSLVNKADAARSLGAVPPFGPFRATLMGYRREWNVITDPLTNPNHSIVHKSGPRAGQPYEGLLAYLGIRRDDHSKCNGAVIGVTREGFAKLLTRELGYSAEDVTEHVLYGTHQPLRLLTFVPKPDRAPQFSPETAQREIVVRKGYLQLVEAAMEEAGALDAFRTSTPASPYRLKDLDRVARRLDHQPTVERRSPDARSFGMGSM